MMNNSKSNTKITTATTKNSSNIRKLKSKDVEINHDKNISSKTTLFVINIQSNVKYAFVNKSTQSTIKNHKKTTNIFSKSIIIDFRSSTKKTKIKTKYNSSNEHYVKTLYKWYEISKIILISGLVIGCIFLSIAITTTIVNLIQKNIRSEYERLDIIDMNTRNHF